MVPYLQRKDFQSQILSCRLNNCFILKQKYFSSKVIFKNKLFLDIVLGNILSHVKITDNSTLCNQVL